MNQHMHDALQQKPTRRRPSVSLLAAIAGAAFAIGAPLSGAGAQGLGLSRSNTPVAISAEQGVEWRQKDKMYIARGNATAKQEGNTVRADELAAHYRKESDGKTRIWKMTATGGVVITTKEDKITGGKATFLVSSGVFILTGGNLKMTSKKRVITASDRIEYRSKEKIAYVVGNAKFVEESRSVRADKFVAYMEAADGQTKMRRVEAVGNVVIVTPNEVARGDKADYDAKTEIATLTGDVRLTRGDNQLNGGKAVVNMKTGISRLIAEKGKPIRGLFIPRDETEDGKKGRLDIPTPGNNNKPGSPKK